MYSDSLKIKTCFKEEQIVVKGENADQQHFFSFSLNVLKTFLSQGSLILSQSSPGALFTNHFLEYPLFSRCFFI